MIPVVIVVALLAAGVWAWQRSRAASDARWLTLHGNVDIRQISLAFAGSERVAEMRAEEGDKVVAGQVL
ncbi:MAG: hypothetical protein Q4G39_09120, partial [Brachymonas sp.]|nr:hypothetical protein [Brachymonas sp.]